jgi:hypothetical protein
MTMRKRDIELIIDLIEGSAEDLAAAHDLISRSEEARAVYEEQIRVRGTLGSAEPVAMTPSERAGLRRDLWSELTGPAPARVKTPWGLRIGQVAAALVLVIGGVAIFGDMAGQGAANDDAGVRSGESGTAFTAAGGEDADPLGGVQGPITEDGGDMPPEAAGIFRRYAELVRAGSIDDLENDPEDARWCQRSLPGDRYLGTIELPDRSVGIWVPAAEELTATIPVRFADTETCDILATE